MLISRKCGGFRSFCSTIGCGLLRSGVYRTIQTAPTAALPLAGVKVLELGQLIAGPFAGQLLGHYGAEVIKIEPPQGGDPLRVWRELDVDGVSPWFRSLGRNKKSVTIDLRTDKGRSLVKQLAMRSDVLLENFKPGTLEKWGLGPDDLHSDNPDLIFTRVSGYGQAGPWANRGGYAAVCEAEAGFRFINGYPHPETGLLDGPPVRPNMSLGDSVAGLHAAFGTVLALVARENRRAAGQRSGQTVDVSILESMLNLMEGIIPEYSRKAKIRGPSGSSVTGIVPTNAYPTSLPSSYIVIGANGDSIYNRLMHKIGRPDLTGPEYARNDLRVKRQAEIEDAIENWTRQKTPQQIEDALKEAEVPVGRIADARDIMRNEHLRERGAIEKVHVGGAAATEGWDVEVTRVAPVLESGRTAATRDEAGPDLGAHNEEVLMGTLGLTANELQDLQNERVVG